MTRAGRQDQDDSIDSIPTVPPDRGSGDSRSKKHGKATILSTKAEHNTYSMNNGRRGVCVVINQMNYEKQPDLKDRSGSDKDAENLKETFENLGFEVHMKEDLNADQFNDELKRWSEYEHEDCDAFVLCILSHGDTENIRHPEGCTPFEEIFEPFSGENCRTLLGKPKMFFIQACQGDKLDERIPVLYETDSGSGNGETQKKGIFRYPSQADFVIFYSTAPGYFSFRNPDKGSWFVQSLCSTLRDMALVDREDVLSLFTMVNNEVAVNFESQVKSNPKLSKRKQVPCFYSTFTKKLYLMPKSSETPTVTQSE